MLLEGLGKLRNISDPIGNRKRYLPACSVVSQRTTFELTNVYIYLHFYIKHAFLKFNISYLKLIFILNFVS
jgi:hypothetical protein